MLSVIKKRFFNQTSLKQRVFTLVGLTVTLLLGSVGAVYIYIDWHQNKTYLVELNAEKARAEASDIKMRTYRAIGIARSMSMSADYMFTSHVAGKDSLLAKTLTNFAQRLSHYNNAVLYHSFYYSLNEQYLTGGEGRRVYLSSIDKPSVTISSKAGLDQSEQDKTIAACESSQKAAASLPHQSSIGNGSASSYAMSITSPIVINGKVVGSAGVDIPLDQIQKIVASIKLPEESSAFLVAQNGEIVAHTDASMVGKKTSYEDQEINTAFENIFQSTDAKQVEEASVDGMSYFVVPVSIDQQGTTWALCISIPNSILFKDLRHESMLAFLIILIGIVVSLIIFNRFAENITRPINIINESIKQLARGEVKNAKRIELDLKTEIGQIANSVNQVIEGLNKTIHFANNIGNGEFSTEYQMLSEKDDLGDSLLEMKDSLEKAKKIEHQRQEEEKLNNWANEGLAKFADILRSSHTNVNELTHEVLSNLVKYIGINQGGIFVLDDQNKNMLNMTACFAYNRRKMLERQVEVGEGLVGRCFIEAEPIYLLEVPEDYISITSGLGDTPPRCLLLVPLKVNDEVNGVIELASIEPISEFKIKFVKKVAESIASTLNSVKVNQRTSQLLNQTKIQAEEMAAAEEELRQNLEELQSTQEEMNRAHEEQKVALERITEDNQMFDALLHSTSEFIFFKNNKGVYVKVSETAKQLIGITNNDDIIGRTAFDIYPHDIASLIQQNDHSVIFEGKPALGINTELRNKHGEPIMVTADHYPVTNNAGVVVGLISIFKKI